MLRTRALLVSGIALVVAILAGCSVVAGDAASGGSSSTSASVSTSSLWDTSVVHEISIAYDDDEYDAMIQTYLDSDEKEWIPATVTIDGVTFEDVGLKLKGNSSLRGLSTDTDADLSAAHPESLPWLIRLDKYVDGQSYDGTTELVVRGNNSDTSLNEAVALELLAATGLAAERPIAVRFGAGGSEQLRLVIENPDDSWTQRELGDGPLYKAEAGGDYSYRGDDPEAYADVFDQEAGDDDLTPLISFLQWLNESSDAEFESDLSAHLDVDAFATYLAFQQLVGNSDDIDGPGNNSYLYADPDTGVMTVVSWDLNLALGVSNGGGGGAGTRDGGAMNTRGGGGGGGARGGSNVLSERFLAVDQYADMVADKLADLQTNLVDSGAAAQILADWTQTLSDQAYDLVDVDTIEAEAARISAQLS